MHRSSGRLTRNRIRSTATTRNTPTPTATVQIRVALGIEETWLASTCKSGSAIVIIIPMTKQTRIRTGSRLDFII